MTVDDERSVFVSYRHESPEHKQWVENLASRLENQTGLTLKLDRWDLRAGDDVAAYTEQGLKNSQWVLMICTPEYKSRFDAREGGVGYEGTVLTGALLNRVQTRVIPVLRKGDWIDAAPAPVSIRRYIDLRGNDWDSGDEYGCLVDTISDRQTRRPRNEKPVFEGPGGAPLTRSDRRFSGRVSELSLLTSTLTGPISSGRCVLVRGASLVGKTALVRQFVATRAQTLFPDGVLWLDGSRLTPELVDAARRLGLNAKGPIDLEMAVAHLECTLEHRRMLVVVDDLDVRQGGLRWLHFTGDRCRLLVTCSGSLSPHSLFAEEPKVIDLAPWTADEFIHFVQKRVPERAHEATSDLNELAQITKGAPLEAQLICSLSGLLTRPLLRDLVDRLRNRLQPGLTQPAVAALVNELLAVISAEDRDVLLSVAACATRTRTEVVAGVAGLTEKDADAALERLLGLSLLDWMKGAPCPWSLHRSLRTALEGLPEAAAFRESHTRWVSAAAFGTSGNGSRRTELLSPEILKVGRRLADKNLFLEATTLFRSLPATAIDGMDPDQFCAIGAHSLVALAPTSSEALWWSEALSRSMCPI